MQNVNQNANSTRVTTGQVRLSYVHLFQPYANTVGQEPKYSVTLLIPKSDIATKQRIDAAIQAAILQGVQGKWNGVRPAQPKTPVWDGDGCRQSGEPFPEECRGHWVMTASSKQMPQVVDTQLNPIIDQTQVYSGIYAYVSLNFFPYFNSGNKGVGCGLNNVMKLADGEPLGGRTTAEDDFAGISVPPQYQQQPQQVYQAYQQYQPAQQQNQPFQQQNNQVQQQYQAIDPITGMPIR